MPTVSLIFQSYPTCPGSESWAQSHHHPEQVQTCRSKNARFVWPFAVLVEDPLLLLLKPSKKEIPMAFYMAKMYVCLSFPQNTWYPGEQEDLSDSVGNRGDPGSLSLGHAHIHRDLPRLLSRHVLGQRSACEGARPGLEVFCSRVGTCQSTLCFSIPGPHKLLLRMEDAAIQ